MTEINEHDKCFYHPVWDIERSLGPYFSERYNWHRHEEDISKGSASDRHMKFCGVSGSCKWLTTYGTHFPARGEDNESEFDQWTNEGGK